MCQCTPTIRTPFCGKGDCVYKKQKKMEKTKCDTHHWVASKEFNFEYECVVCGTLGFLSINGIKPIEAERI